MERSESPTKHRGDSRLLDGTMLPFLGSVTVAPTSTVALASSSDVTKPVMKRIPAAQRSNASNTNPTTAATRLRLYKSDSRSKWVTREIAALEFLLGIPLEAEPDIVRSGWMQLQGISDGQNKLEETGEEKVELLEPPTHQVSARTANLSAHHSHHGRWWEKWINNPKPSGGDLISRRSRVEDDELEQPYELGASRGSSSAYRDHAGVGTPHDSQPSLSVSVPVVHAPGRRLQGDEATKVQIPIMDGATVITRQKNIARMAFTREWEIQVAHGIGDVSGKKTARVSLPSQKQRRPPMLDGRLFFSAGESYPIHVYSLLRYEPKKEEAARRRQKLEARGGGGTQFFIMPVRDWRGISYRALLPPKAGRKRRPKNNDALLRFDRFASSSSDNVDNRSKRSDDGDIHGRSKNHDFDDLHEEDEDNDESDESDEEDSYIVGLLDDPEMVQGRHRNVMIGDRVTGAIVSSTIQFVKPQLLKADLNKQFRERFDGWEPPKSQRKYIGARVVDGVYTLMDPGTIADDTTLGTAEEDSHQQTVVTTTTGTTMTTSVTPRKRQGSMSSMSTAGDAKETIRMPPSLTLSKIRSIKQQALRAAVTAKLEISTVALSIIYFERLCLDCRVDKTNRRLSFAACLLLALKMNEAHVELMTKPGQVDSKSSTSYRIQSLLRPAKKSDNAFASLLEFFTQEWTLSLKHLFAAEWGVFAALQFRLHAKPSQIAFHFKRLLKAMDWNPRAYLGPQMYSFWMDALAEEDYQRRSREERKEARLTRKERKRIMHLQRELEASDRSETVSPSRIMLEDQLRKDERHDSARDNGSGKGSNKVEEYSPLTTPNKGSRQSARGAAGLGRILTHFAGGKRALSTDKLLLHDKSQEINDGTPCLQPSPSMPIFPSSDVISNGFVIEIPAGDEQSEFQLPGRQMTDQDGDDEMDGIIV